MFNIKIVLPVLILFIVSGCETSWPGNSPGSGDASSSSYQSFGRKAKEDLWRVETIARRWDLSSRLVKSEARDIDSTGASFWFYYYKSPFIKNVPRIDNNGNTAEVENLFFGSDIDPNIDWKIDSDKAVEIARKAGLKKFPVLEMTMESRFLEPEWELRTWDGYFRINARDGIITVNKKN